MNKKNFYHTPLLVAILIFSVFYFFSTVNGMNFTADSKHYIKVAEQIYQNGFISIWKNKHLVYWPPLYPYILSLFVESNLQTSIKLLHYLLTVIIIIIWYFISSKTQKDQMQIFLFMILLAFSTNLLMISVFVWSELLFLALFSLMILFVQNYFNSKKIFWLLISVLPAFLMMIQRNAGIFIITPFYFALIVFQFFPQKHYKFIILCFILSILGFAIWNIHHIALESRFYMVAELVPYFIPVKNYTLLFNEIGAIFYPSLALYPWSIFFTTGIFFYGSYLIFKSSGISFLKIVYLTALMYLSIWIVIPGDPSNMSRFVSVVTPILLLAFVEAFYNAWQKFSLPNYLKYILLCLFILYASARVLNNAFLWGGAKRYKNFGKIHENVFYEKYERVIGRPSSE